MQSYVRFNRVPEKAPEKVSEKVPGEGLGGFGAEPGQVQQRSREGSGEVLGGSEIEVPEKVLEKVPEGLGAARFNEASRCDCGSVSA